MAEPESRYKRRGREIRYYNDDGLAEMCIGAGILLAGLTVSQESPAAILWLLPAVVAMTLAKKGITEPRLKWSEIDPAMVRRAAADTGYSTSRAATKAVTLLAVAIAFVLYELLARSKSDLSPDFRQQPVFLVVGVVGACFGAGYQYRAPRLVTYGALAAVLFFISLLSGLSLRSITIFTGLVMVVTGSFYLFRFLQSHPTSGASQ